MSAHTPIPPQERGLAKLMHLTRLMMYGDRQPLTSTPEDAGMPFEEVSFPATDGVDLAGWFIPSGVPGPGPAVVFVHGWLWNRLGNTAGRVPFTDRDVDFLPPAKTLHEHGFHVLLFELANHGESGKRPPITYGRWEARDVNGALAYLRSRGDVDADRIGAVGTSAGANAVMYAIPDGPPLRAFLAVQPTRLSVFNANFARDELGPFGPAEARSMDLLYIAMGAPLPSRHNPAKVAPLFGDTVVQYVQGTGDPWGRMDVVEEFSAATPHSQGVIAFPSTGRYEGYRYVTERPAEVAEFFVQHM